MRHLSPRWSRACLAAAALACLRAPARADDPAYETTVTGSRNDDEAVRDLDATADETRRRTGFVTILDARRAAEEAVDLAEALAETVGLHVRSLGGLGAFSSVSVRGASPGQLSIYIDGVPLTRDAATSVDLGDLALESLDRVEVYRGAVPIELGGGLGGAIHLVTRAPGRGDRSTVSASIGSFGARRLVLARRARAGRVDYAASATYAGAAGDYVFFDDHGTPYNLDDDAFRRREGNGYDQVETALRIRLVAPARAELGVRAFVKTQGLPPTASIPGPGATLDTFRVVNDSRIERSRRSGALTATFAGSGWALATREHYQDAAGRVGLGNQDRRYTTLAGGAGARLSLATTRQRFTFAPDLRYEWFDEEDRAAGGSRGGGRRLGLALGAREELWLGASDNPRAQLEAGVRIDVLASDPTGGSLPVPAFIQPPTGDTRAYASPRAGARVRLVGELHAKANAGRYVRVPTFVELYGDRGATVGNPALRAETGLSGDLGLVYAPRPPASNRGSRVVDRILLEVAAFASRPHDTIVFVPTSRVAVATNLGDANLAGVELAGAIRFARTLTLSANYTYTDAENRGPPATYAGKRLPGRPAHELYARSEVARSFGPKRNRRSLSLAYDLAVLAGDYLDPSNFSPAPSRAVHGISLGVRPGWGVKLAVDLKNLTDDRVATIRPDPAPRPDLTEIPVAISDVLGQPLPGRALFLTLSWSSR